jgi:hypothetical protein
MRRLQLALTLMIGCGDNYRPIPDANDIPAWTAPLAISLDGIPSGEPAVAADGDHVFVAFMEHVEVTAGSGANVRLLVSDDAGLTFRTALTYASTAASSFHFAGDVTVAASPSGDIYLAFIDYRYDTSSSEVMFSASHDHGATWPTPTVVTGTQGPAFEDRPWLAIDPATGGLALGNGVLTSDTSGTSLVRRSTDHGVSWTDALTVGTGEQTRSGALDGLLAYTAPTFAPDGEILCAAQKGDGTGAQHIELLHGSRAPLTDLSVHDMAQPQRAFPSVAASANGTCVSYLDGVNGRLFAQVSSDGRSFGAPVELDDATPDQGLTQPWLALDPAGRCLLLWYQGKFPDATVKSRVITPRGETLPIQTLGPANIVLDESDETKWPGDYVSITATARHEFAAWTGSQSGISRVYLAAASL